MNCKPLIIFISLFAMSAIAGAQPRLVDRSIEVRNGDTITLDLKFGESIVIKAWDEERVSFRASIEINGGALNEALLLDYNQGNGLRITADYDEQLLRSGTSQDCKDSRQTTMNWNQEYRYGYTVCSNIHYEIMIPRFADLEVESISSDIEIYNLKGPVRAKTISGFVDLSWPGGRGADFSMKTISGEVYSGLEQLELINRKGRVPLVGYELRGSVGHGGPYINLESISGNIYLRQANEI
jgi:hypothetical protein